MRIIFVMAFIKHDMFTTNGITYVSAWPRSLRSVSNPGANADYYV